MSSAAKPTPIFYLLHGEDDLSVEEAVGKMVRDLHKQPNADLNLARFDAATTPTSEIFGAAMAYPFMADKRLVIVRDYIGWYGRKGAGETGKRALEHLAITLPDLPDWTRFVLLERGALAENHRFVKLIRDHPAGYEKNFALPANPTDWIMRRARDVYASAIDPQAAAVLASVTTGDLRRADSELYKLALYVDGQHPITEADVAALTPYVPETTGFALVDALVEGRGAAASLTIRRLLEQDEDIFMIYGLIVRQFRLLVIAREHLDLGGGPAGLRDALGIRSDWQVEKIAKQARAFDLPRLEGVYRRLHEYDVQIKTGRIEAGVALDLVIAALNRT